MVNRMNIFEKKHISFYVVLINIALILFMLTDDNTDLSYAVTAGISSIIAIIFNTGILIHSKNKTLNVISLVINVLIFFALIIYTIKKYNLI